MRNTPSAFDAIHKLVRRIDSLPPETWENTPDDLAINVDYYLYGLPKVKNNQK